LAVYFVPEYSSIHLWFSTDSKQHEILFCSSKLVYKGTSIISGTGAAIWSKTNFEPTGHHHLLLVCTVPRASVIFRCILEAVFCESV
jgi:hypothetical protein